MSRAADGGRAAPSNRLLALMASLGVKAPLPAVSWLWMALTTVLLEYGAAPGSAVGDSDSGRRASVKEGVGGSVLRSVEVLQADEQAECSAVEVGG